VTASTCPCNPRLAPIFSTVEEAQTSTDPVKLARAVAKCADDAMREVGRGSSRGSYVYAMCAAHYANRLAQLRIHQPGDSPNNHPLEK
jgi:hypothetical protein